MRLLNREMLDGGNGQSAPRIHRGVVQLDPVAS